MLLPVAVTLLQQPHLLSTGSLPGVPSSCSLLLPALSQALSTTMSATTMPSTQLSSTLLQTGPIAVLHTAVAGNLLSSASRSQVQRVRVSPTFTCSCPDKVYVNPLTPTVAIWVQL